MSATFLTIKKNRNLPRGAKRSGGTSLVEMILYMVILTFVMIVIVQTLIAVGGVYRNIKLTRELESSGTIAMESMLREIRNASNVNTGKSTLGTSLGSIVVLGTDDDQNPYEITFDVASGALRVAKDSEAPAAITSSPSTISYLLFNHITNANSEGVRIELEISGTAGSVSKSERFYGFAVLRGSY